ncbi:MAG: adenylyltransferase/cytidyltransferase family protein [Gammaproteobacteria bacterium]|nr:adenylyltransferase/cytidyltransferase family protein [Gammaproteobacteria bacterium]
MTQNKIISLDEMATIALELKQAEKIVLCHGTFDLLHIGHIKHLQRAREEGDKLFVTVTSDQFINKGPGRPVFNENLRAESLAAIECVDYVAINHAETSVPVIEAVKPDCYVKGGDYKNQADDVTGNISVEHRMVEKFGGRIFFTDELTSSSTRLLNEYFDVFSPETYTYLHQFKEQHHAESLIANLKDLHGLNVLVLGEAIVDEYHYTSPLGQTGKGNVLSVKYEDREQFAGGAVAIANHIAGFVDNVTILTGLGELNSHEKFIRSKLLDNVTAEFFMLKDRPTIVKRRYVDGDISKLFEVYFYNEADIPKDVDERITAWLDENLPRYDVVMVADFGNGFISDAMVNTLSKGAKFLAVNAQTNSGNRGYHFITRYPRADFVSLNEPELRLSTLDKQRPIDELAKEIVVKLNAQNVAVTRGTRGAMIVSKEDCHEIPALSSKVVDRVGAGDSFLALSGLCLAGGLPAETALIIGSAAAALDVQIVCNREPVKANILFKYLQTLLK